MCLAQYYRLFNLLQYSGIAVLSRNLVKQILTHDSFWFSPFCIVIYPPVARPYKEKWQTKPFAKRNECKLVSFDPLSDVCGKSQPISTTISAHHCLVLSHYLAVQSAAASAATAVLNFEMDGPSAACQIASSKWPAYSPLAVDTLPTSLLTETHQRKSKRRRPMKADTHGQRAGGRRDGFIYIDQTPWILLGLWQIYKDNSWHNKHNDLQALKLTCRLEIWSSKEGFISKQSHS